MGAQYIYNGPYQPQRRGVVLEVGPDATTRQGALTMARLALKEAGKLDDFDWMEVSYRDAEGVWRKVRQDLEGAEASWAS